MEHKFKLKHLVLSPNTPVDLLFRHSGSKLQSLSSLTVGHLSTLSWTMFPNLRILETFQGFASMEPLDFIQYLYNEDECNVVLIGNGSANQMFDTVMNFCKTLSLHPSVYMFPNTGSIINLSYFLRSNMKKLHVINREYCCVTSVGNIPLCPHLTELHLVRIQSADLFNGIDILATHGLCSAVNDGKPPELAHLNFDSSIFSVICTNDLFSYLRSFSSFVLFSQCKWVTLTHLSLLNSEIHRGNNRHFSKALSQGSFPQLKSLKISREFGEIRDLFKSEWPKLQSLILQDFGHGNEVLAIFEQLYFPNLIELGLIRPWGYLNLSRISNTVPRLERLTVHDLSSPEGGLPYIQFAWELCELDSSHCSSLGGKLYMLLQHSFPSLYTLILSDCELSSEDLTSLAQARTKRSLPKLRHLDISMNKRCGDI